MTENIIAEKHFIDANYYLTALCMKCFSVFKQRCFAYNYDRRKKK